MIRRMLLLAALAVIIAVSASPALAERRIALVIGMSAYQNIPRLDNPRNDAMLMASTLQELGFTLIGGGARLDLDKYSLDRTIQEFGAAIQGADVAMFYYAGHGVQVRGANYLVPVGANPTREADVDFQMVDINLVLLQMEDSGARLNLVVLDACRNNPFGGSGLRATNGGLAQMRAPQGTLISFATQPGSVALDGDGNSPYTRALATTIRKPGLDIFQTFNEVGLAVKRATGGTQQPWVSSSPIDGSFYFSAPPVANVPSTASDDAAQAWAATRDSTSIAVLDTFIRQYGNSIYAPFARARLDELKNSRITDAAPEPQPHAVPTMPRLARANVEKMFGIFNQAMTQIRKNYVDKRDDREIFIAANKAMLRAFPLPQAVSSAGAIEIRAPDGGRGDLDSVYDTALAVMNAQPSNKDDVRIVEVALKGALASLDPHSSYMNPQAYREMQTQSRGTFGGIGTEVNLTDGLLKVVSPIDDSPAMRAGVRANDVIVSIDDQPTRGLTLNQAVERMRGPVNSMVAIRIVRPNVPDPILLTLTRDTIRVRAVRWYIDGGDIGYIRISSFNEQTEEAFKQAIAAITNQVANDNLKGYIIDLRNNSGGLLASVLAVADDVLERGEVVSLKGRTETARYKAKAGDLSKGKKIVVLINGGTASGSEIFAGALQDNKRATLVGTRSFGKGSVQTIFPLGADQGALLLTTSRYFTPSGTSIQAMGISPDLEVLQDEPATDRTTAPKGEAALSGHLPGRGAEQVASQSYVPADPRDDKAIAAAQSLLRRGSR